MTYAEVLKLFKTQNNIAIACNVTRQAVTRWARKGLVPDKQQWHLQDLTKRKLKRTPPPPTIREQARYQAERRRVSKLLAARREKSASLSS